MPNAINCVRLCATIKWGLFLWSQKNVTLDLCILIWNQMISLCLNRTEANSLKLWKLLCLSKHPLRLNSLRKANTLFELGNPNVGTSPHNMGQGLKRKNSSIQQNDRTVSGLSQETTEKPQKSEDETSVRWDICSGTNGDHASEWLTDTGFPEVGGRRGECQQSIIFKR